MPLVALRFFDKTFRGVRKRQLKATVNDKLQVIYEMLPLGARSGALLINPTLRPTECSLSVVCARVALNQGNAQIKLGRGGRV